MFDPEARAFAIRYDNDDAVMQDWKNADMQRAKAEQRCAVGKALVYVNGVFFPVAYLIAL